MTIKTILKQRRSRLRAYCIVLLIIFLTLPGAAQDTWPSAKNKRAVYQVKGNKTLFNCTIIPNKKGLYLISNSKFDDPLKGRKEHSNSYDEQSIVKLVSHDSVVCAIKKTFTEERMEKLIEADEDLNLSVYIDENGKVIKLTYSLEIGTSILPSEIEVLERNLLESLKFNIEGKKYEIPIVYSAYISVNFQEVMKGEMRRVRNLETEGIL